MKTFTVKTEIPSGKIVFSNAGFTNLVEIFTMDSELEKLNYNSLLKVEAEHYQKQGVIYIGLLNDSPMVYKHSDSNLQVRTIIEDESFLTANNIQKCGQVVTDSWSYCAMDYDLFITKGGEKKLAPRNYFIVSVEPGTYSFSSRPIGEPEIYSEIMKVK